MKRKVVSPVLNTKLYVLLLFSLWLLGGAKAQWRNYFPKELAARTVSITVTGDIMQHLPQIVAARCGENRFDYSSSFHLIAPYLQTSDIAIGNLELTLGGPPYTGYPCFSAPDTLLYFLKRAGFSVLTTANNHTCDRKSTGILRTIRQLEEADIPFTGTFRNAAERDSLTPRIIEKNGLRMALLAYTYGTNGIPFAPPLIVNLIDTLQIARDIEKAKQVADFIVVAMHWGQEYHDAPSREQRVLADFLLQQGVTLVVGNHPHVVQPIRIVRDSNGVMRQMCIYSLGNFISAQRTFPRAGSMLVHLVVEQGKHGLAIRAPEYLLTYVEQTRGARENFRILPIEVRQKETNSYAERYRLHAESILADVEKEIEAVHKRLLPYVHPSYPHILGKIASWRQTILKQQELPFYN